MKKLLFLSCLFASFFAMSQPVYTFTAPSGTVDSATVKYSIWNKSAGGSLTIYPMVTKSANTGTTAAGICWLEQSPNGTTGSWSPVFTNKYVNYNNLTPANVIGPDTLSYSTTGTTQVACRSNNKGGCWVVNSFGNHPAIYYRVVWTATTAKVTPVVEAVLR